jgi:hypothetical protein
MYQDKLAESDNWSDSYKPQQGSTVIGVKGAKIGCIAYLAPIPCPVLLYLICPWHRT